MTGFIKGHFRLECKQGQIQLKPNIQVSVDGFTFENLSKLGIKNIGTDTKWSYSQQINIPILKDINEIQTISDNILFVSQAQDSDEFKFSYKYNNTLHSGKRPTVSYKDVTRFPYEFGDLSLETLSKNWGELQADGTRK